MFQWGSNYDLIMPEYPLYLMSHFMSPVLILMMGDDEWFRGIDRFRLSLFYEVSNPANSGNQIERTSSSIKLHNQMQRSRVALVNFTYFLAYNACLKALYPLSHRFVKYGSSPQQRGFAISRIEWSSTVFSHSNAKILIDFANGI